MRPIASRSKFILRNIILPGSLLLTPCTLSVSISRNTSPAAIEKTQSAPTSSFPRHAHWLQVGRASWYGSHFQGQATASGEAFNMYGMTCAHRSLPIGSLIRVTNLHNHKSVVVRVNDRGPNVSNRVVDLSYAAARIIGFRGMTRVRLDLIDAAPTAAEVTRLTWVDPAKE